MGRDFPKGRIGKILCYTNYPGLCGKCAKTLSVSRCGPSRRKLLVFSQIKNTMHDFIVLFRVCVGGGEVYEINSLDLSKV